MAHTLFIETTAVNTFLDSQSWTYVQAGTEFTRKKARDLHLGDLVVVENEAIHKTLPDIVPFLEESMRYQLAARGIFETNSHHERIPRLRTTLLRALADPATPNLEAKIMLEGDDFSPEEYTTFKQQIQTYVALKDDAIEDWLSGKTIAPREWDNFYRLAPLSTTFSDFADTFAEDHGFYADYQLYTGVRRTIMNYLRHVEQNQKREGTAPPIHRNDTNRGKYTAEIELVVGHFIHEIDRERSVARITSIKEAKDPASVHSQKQTARPEPHLTRGIITQPLDLPVLDMNTLIEEAYILENILTDIADKYAITIIDPQPQSMNELLKNYVLGIVFPAYLAMNLQKINHIEHYSFQNNFASAATSLKGRLDKKDIEQILKNAYETFLADLHAGTVDQACNMTRNTAANLIETLNQHRSALPKAYFERKLQSFRRKYTSIDYKIGPTPNKREKREQQATLQRMDVQINRAEKYLLQTYGLTFEHQNFFPAIHDQMTAGVEDDPERIVQPGELMRAKTRYEQQGYQFYTRAEVNALLSRLGVPSAIHIFGPRTFLETSFIYPT